MSARQVSKEQIEQARRLDLLSYLEQYAPQELVKISSGVFSTRSHDSLKISNGKWYQWSAGVGGVSALDYLVKVQDMDFVSAVLQVLDCGQDIMPTTVCPVKRTKPVDFVLPAPYANNNRVLSYLMGRGLSEDLLSMCIGMDLLYEDTRHNCVFVGFDRDDTPRYAMLRSSSPASTFLCEVEGSDKRYSFSLPHNSRETLYVFESAIDCLSYIEMQRMKKPLWKPDNYLSLSGVYQPGKDKTVELPVALEEYLSNRPNIRHIALCLDNDEIGRKAAAAICAALPEQYTTELMPPKVGKDYNEQLMLQKHIEMPVKTRGAHSAKSHSMEEKER